MTASALGFSGLSTPLPSTPSAALPPLPDKIRAVVLDHLQRWIDARLAEVDYVTYGWVIVADYVIQPDHDGRAWCYSTEGEAQAACVRVMRADESLLVLPCPVDRYRGMLEAQLEWARRAISRGS